MSSLNLVVLCYDVYFPSRIGGNRWRNMIHSLRKSHRVTVIGAGKPDNYELGKDEYLINSNYPDVLLSKPIDLVSKLKYRAALLEQKLMTSGSLYDRAARDERQIIAQLDKILELNKPDAIIASGAPFSLLHSVVQYARRKEVFSVVDFRDPWTWGSGYGFSQLSNTRLHHEKQMERFTCENSGLIISPSQEILGVISKRFPRQERTLHLPHGISPQLITIKKEFIRPKRKDKQLNLVYAGTLYAGFESVIEQFRRTKEVGELDFKLDIYTSSDTALLQERIRAANLLSQIRVCDYLDAKAIAQKLLEADGAFIYYPEQYKDFVSTKFIELAYLNVPILLLAKNGRAANFISENNTGITQEQLNLVEFANFIDTVAQKTFAESSMVNYTYDNLAEKLINNIKK